MRRNWIAIAVLTLAAAGQALAADEEQKGGYVGVGIGDFQSQLDQLNGAQINFDESATAYKIFGGWRFNQFLAAQIDYLDLGSSDERVGTQNVSLDTKGYTARIEGTLPLGPFELFATGGLIFSTVKADVNGRQVLDSSDNDPIYSVGGGLEIAERFVLRLEYEVIDIQSLDDAKAWWFTAAWRF